jgi:Ca2+-binding EF-hand superfamily protein
MWTQWLTFGTLAIATLGGDAAQSQRAQARMRFEVMDRDGNGEISRAEWRGSARSFQVHDWNGDGRLSGNEVRPDGWQQQDDLEGADHNPSQAERYMNWTERGFLNLDHNRDRRITSNEWHFDREAFVRADRNRDGVLSSAEFIGADMDDDRGDRFEDLDADGNGRVERNEWHASDDAFVWLDRNRDGILTRREVVGSEAASGRLDQFASLDVDGNGRVERNEWHWSAGSFASRDANGDGALSRREYAAAASPAAAGALERPATVTVDARERWTDTQVDVRAGDVIEVSARGSITMSQDDNDTATPAGSRTGRGAQQAPLPAVAGALIARIGDAAPVLVGNRQSFTADRAGRLYLGVNDDHLADNRGQFDVTVSVQSRRGR